MKTINNEVIYQIYPLTFNYAPGSKSDPYKGAYGNLKGVTALADYVSSLGVDAIWITPFYPWNGTGFGYDITDYCAIDPMFGDIDDFKELCQVYHNKKIRVIIDQVYNHCAETHPWFQKSIEGIEPYKDYFIWADAKDFDDEGKPIIPNNWKAIWNRHGESVWEWSDKRKQFYMHTFDYSMPNININNPLVQDELLNIAKFWFDLGADGFRLDAAVHYACDPSFRDNPIIKNGEFEGQQDRIYDIQTVGGKNFLKRLRKLCDSYETPKTLLAEFSHKMTSKKATKRVKSFFNHPPFDAGFSGALNFGLPELRYAIQKELFVSPFGKNINWALSSHDVERVGSRMFGNDCSISKKKMLMHLLLSLPGSICIFQGDELGLDNPLDFSKCKSLEFDPKNIWENYNSPWDASRAGFAMSDNEDDVTRKMALHPDEKQYELAVSNQNFAGSIFNETRMFIKERKNSIFSEHGNVYFIDDICNDEVIAFVRTNVDGTKEILLVYNFSNSFIKFSYLGENYVLSAQSFMQKVIL
ncbi:MAG: hypothetical protein IJZ30_03280 [Alphaproteobacteria bacterium]|nr:hypothetical protein [Alphaproteobacteria bacterium]